jgi:hypothetical protein
MPVLHRFFRSRVAPVPQRTLITQVKWTTRRIPCINRKIEARSALYQAPPQLVIWSRAAAYNLSIWHVGWPIARILPTLFSPINSTRINQIKNGTKSYMMPSRSRCTLQRSSVIQLKNWGRDQPTNHHHVRSEECQPYPSRVSSFLGARTSCSCKVGARRMSAKTASAQILAVRLALID